MTGARTPQTAIEPDAPAEDGWFIDESVTTAPLAAQDEARFEPVVKPGLAARTVFFALLFGALLIHAAIIAVSLWRDAREPPRTVQMEETPVEVVVETPPEPEKPKPPELPKPPEPPKPKEDLSPAYSAPRAPSEDQIKTPTKEAKTAAPTKQATPTQGQPQAAPAAAPPEPETKPPETKKEEAAKEEDKTKPDAEALDRAKRKAAKAKQSHTKEAKSAPRRKMPNALAALAGAPQLDATMSFARPTPKTKIYGGTEDVRWMSQVQGMLEAKTQQLPRGAHYQSGGTVAICFHVDVSGRVIHGAYCQKSGYPDVDALAMRALQAAAPFPPPPPGLDRGLVWIQTFDGQLPKLHFR